MLDPVVTPFFDEASTTVSYLVQYPQSHSSAVIDSVLGFDYAGGRTYTASADAICQFVKERDLEMKWVLETHMPAEPLSAAPLLQRRLGGKMGIGARFTEVQDIFGQISNAGTEFQRDGRQFDALLGDKTHSTSAI